MASRLHWISGGVGPTNVTTPGVTTLPNTDLTLPVNAVLKKVLMHQTAVQGISHGFVNSAITTYYWQRTVSFIGGPYNGRQIYSDKVDIPFNAFGYTDVGTGNYWQIFHGGDNTGLGFNQRYDYGTSPATTVTLRLGGVMSGGGGTTFGISLWWQFAALYWL